MSTHVGNTYRSGFYHLWQLCLIRLTVEMAATLVQAFVLTRIDYCNAVPIGTGQATTEPASDGSQHCSPPALANTDI